MSPVRRNVILVMSLVAMLYFAASAFHEFVAAGEPLGGVAVGALIPVASLWEVMRARQIGPDAIDAVVRMLPIVTLALAGVSMVSP